jgi:hypothetical protein
MWTPECRFSKRVDSTTVRPRSPVMRMIVALSQCQPLPVAKKALRRAPARAQMRAPTRVMASHGAV